jgi:type I restriction enzyme S subunit
MAKNITENKIESIQMIYLDNEKLPSRARRKVDANDILYSTVRPIQRHYGRLKNTPENFLVSTGFTTISTL